MLLFRENITNITSIHVLSLDYGGCTNGGDGEERGPGTTMSSPMVEMETMKKLGT